MKTILNIGQNRLTRILAGDKNQSPEKFCSLIKSDLKALLAHYLEVDEEINVHMQTIGDEFVFFISFKAVRMKSLGIIP
jgi:septum formation topological specificity factor MinE